MAHWHSRLAQILTADYCPLYILWPPWSAPHAGQQLRLWASRYQGRGQHALLRQAFVVALIITWPLRACILIGQNLRKYARPIAQRTAISVWRQGCEQLWLAFVHALPPAMYYHYELYRPQQRPLVDYYLHQHEMTSLLPSLNQYQRHPAIDDKALFAALCATADLPTAPILAYCQAGQVRWQGEPLGDLFAKPVNGSRGEGALRWRRLDANRYQDEQGAVLSWQALSATLAALSKERAYLVQPCLVNHPAIAFLSPNALATLRIVTGRTPDGAIEPIAATFKMAWQPLIINTHGLNSPVDLATGQLASAYSYHPISRSFDKHPVTDAQIKGCTLPDWQRALALALRAHQHVPAYVFLGWDVALTPDGPCLLEGNAGWDVLSMQKPAHIPLAQTRFASICRLWLEHQR
jgi:hypothetical protein